MERRDFMKMAPLVGAAGIVLPSALVFRDKSKMEPSTKVKDERAYWADMLERISEPVLYHLSKGDLRKNMPVETHDGNIRDRASVTHLEALGRTLAGVAPWLALPDTDDNEGAQRKKLREYAVLGIEQAFNPASPDYMNFTKGTQPLVDAAFLVHGFLRAPKALWEPLDASIKRRVIAEIKNQRAIKPWYSNWLLFAAMNEAFLLSVGDDEWDPMRVDFAVKKHQEWYLGDGWYGDGPDFHLDYYNSYVIQPMLLEILKTLSENGKINVKDHEQALQRMQRYAVQQERLISPEGTYPPFGRSIAYRAGAFQALADIALQKQLPDDINPAQVRCALTQLFKNQFGMEGTFDNNGWLQLGFCGHQPEVADSYISTGSLYLCTLGFLPLGLPPEDDFWSNPAADWTSKKAWAGKSFTLEHAI